MFFCSVLDTVFWREGRITYILKKLSPLKIFFIAVNYDNSFFQKVIEMSGFVYKSWFFI